eukprot:11508063-Ditylum_brightwellii.AAC.1
MWQPGGPERGRYERRGAHPRGARMAMKRSVAADAPRPGGRHARITRAGGRSPSANSSLRDLPMMQRGGGSN